MYRMQKIDRRSTYMHWQIHKDGRMDYLAADGRLDVAVALGLDPITAYAASAPLPKHIDELMLAGFLRGDAVELVKGKTVDLEVPASAEIVLEGYVEAGDEGDRRAVRRPHRLLLAARAVPRVPPHRDDDAARRDLPVDRRRQAAGRGRVARQGDGADLPAGRAYVGAGDRRLRPAGRPGAFHNCAIVSIRKTFPGQAQKIMHAIWGLGMLSLTKCVVVVDEWVDVHDYGEVFFRVTANVDPKRDVLLSEGPVDHLDHAPGTQFVGGKLGIDATHKLPEEGAREWPPEIEMSDEVKELVARRWSEYGLPDLHA